MAVAKLKRPKEDQFEELAERIATEINERAAKMTPEERAKADSETKKDCCPSLSVLERVNPRNASPNNQRVDIMGPFVGFYAF